MSDGNKPEQNVRVGAQQPYTPEPSPEPEPEPIPDPELPPDVAPNLGEVIERIEQVLGDTFPEFVQPVIEGVEALGEITVAAVIGVLVDAGIPSAVAAAIAPIIVLGAAA